MVLVTAILIHRHSLPSRGIKNLIIPLIVFDKMKMKMKMITWLAVYFEQSC